ncbi:hypothetical protein HDF14_003058 [Edaphobacter lichenicola]|uniref:Uncharacterized protein n=1 Tax=Tunturiibacter gelidiferens TaxID=3069689 RepID=A0A9X0U4X8_9BACT|nr:hypothetical protein [Edaphobacter lichenicola]
MRAVDYDCAGVMIVNEIKLGNEVKPACVAALHRSDTTMKVVYGVTRYRTHR